MASSSRYFVALLSFILLIQDFVAAFALPGFRLRHSSSSLSREDNLPLGRAHEVREHVRQLENGSQLNVSVTLSTTTVSSNVTTTSPRPAKATTRPELPETLLHPATLNSSRISIVATTSMINTTVATLSAVPSFSTPVRIPASTFLFGPGVPSTATREPSASAALNITSSTKAATSSISYALSAVPSLSIPVRVSASTVLFGPGVPFTSTRETSVSIFLNVTSSTTSSTPSIPSIVKQTTTIAPSQQPFNATATLSIASASSTKPSVLTASSLQLSSTALILLAPPKPTTSVAISPYLNSTVPRSSSFVAATSSSSRSSSQATFAPSLFLPASSLPPLPRPQNVTHTSAQSVTPPKPPAPSTLMPAPSPISLGHPPPSIVINGTATWSTRPSPSIPTHFLNSSSLATPSKSTAIHSVSSSAVSGNFTFVTSYRPTILSTPSSTLQASSITQIFSISLSPSQYSVLFPSAPTSKPSTSFTFFSNTTTQSSLPAITISKYVPTFTLTQTITSIETRTTMFVINPSQTSTILGVYTITSTSVVTTTGYDCKATNNPPPSTAGKVTLSGISLSGFENGCDTDGSCELSKVQSPMSAGYNVTGQMQHFMNDDGFNTFRLPVSWQYLIKNADKASATLNTANFGVYDQLVQACLKMGAFCVIDLHNYGRFEGDLIGQGSGPTNAWFAQLWGAIAAKYASQPHVIFGLMNQVSATTGGGFGTSASGAISMTTWAKTLQGAVTAIRSAGASSQIILLRGTDFTGTTGFVSATFDSLATIKDTKNSTDLLMFDIQKHLETGTGKTTGCTTSYVTEAFTPAAQWLRCHGRQAVLTELGGDNTNSCLTYMCPAVSFLNANSDVFVGYIAWASGDLSVSSTLPLAPAYYNSAWIDQILLQTCLKPRK